MQVVGIEDRADLVQRKPSDGCDLGFGAAHEREPCDRRPAKIVPIASLPCHRFSFDLLPG